MTEDIKPAAPRLQLRWEAATEEDKALFHIAVNWVCHYELVLPLQKHDIRREVYEGGERVDKFDELIVPLKGPTGSGAGLTPCTLENGDNYYDPPYRDGCHATWDAALLGGLPIYVLTPGGKYISKPADPTKEEVAHIPHTDCRMPDGIVVGLIDGIIAQCRVIAKADLSPDAVRAALADLRADQDVKAVVR